MDICVAVKQWFSFFSLTVKVLFVKENNCVPFKFSMQAKATQQTDQGTRGAWAQICLRQFGVAYTTK